MSKLYILALLTIGMLLLPMPASALVARLNLTYPEEIELPQGESESTIIVAKNIGEVTLYNLRIYSSTVNAINSAITPKQVGILNLNQSATFLVSIDAPSTTLAGSYPFDFELMSDELKEVGRITLKVVSVSIPKEEELQSEILKYELLISEIERGIFSASSNGFDVRLANQSLNNAKISLETAKDFFKSMKLEDVKKELIKMKGNLEDAVLQLAIAVPYTYGRPLPNPFWIIAIIALLTGAGVWIYFYFKKKRKGRRPKLLRDLGESETEK